MKQKALVILMVGIMFFGLLTGCKGKDTQPVQQQDATDNNASSQTDSEQPNEVKTVDNNWGDMTWTEVLEEAKGQTVNWYMWGGSAVINTFVDEVIAERAAQYGIKLNRVGVTSISEAITKVMGEKTAGKDTNGEVDLIWINGANFMTMKQADVLFGPWSESIENAVFVNWEEPSIKYDMGFEVEGYESPWAAAQMQLIYDSQNYSEDALPHNYAQLLEWCKANPGRFTYVAAPDFMGTRFIKQALYELTGGYEQYMRDDITKEEFEEMSQPVWDYFNELAPYLWREGKTYPKSSSELNMMFSNNEVDYSMTLSAGGISSSIAAGTFTETSKVYTMDTSIGDVNYVAIPYNSSAKAAAMVIANIILSPATQAQGIVDISNGPVIDSTLLSEKYVEIIKAAYETLPVGTFVKEQDLIQDRVPEVSGYLNVFINELWNEKVSTR